MRISDWSSDVCSSDLMCYSINEIFYETGRRQVKIKFGIRLTVQGEMGATSSGFEYALGMAQIAEDLGFDSVWIPDHVENAHLDRSKPILEYWTTVTALGALTKHVRLGGHSLNNTFRTPGLPPKIACPLNHLTHDTVNKTNN